MSEFTDYLKTSLVIFISTVIVMYLRFYLPYFLFPGFMTMFSITMVSIILEALYVEEDHLIRYIATFIAVFLAGFCLIILGFSIHHIFEVRLPIDTKYIYSISAILESPVLSQYHIVEATIIGFVAAKVKLLFLFLFRG